MKTKIHSLRKNNVGIETRVLIYALAAILLVASIGIALSAMGSVSSLMGKANETASKVMDKTSEDLLEGMEGELVAPIILATG